MKNRYEIPELEVIDIAEDDIIITSGDTTFDPDRGEWG